MEKCVKILWKNPQQSGKVELRNAGKVSKLSCSGTAEDVNYSVTDGVLYIHVPSDLNPANLYPQNDPTG